MCITAVVVLGVAAALSDGLLMLLAGMAWGPITKAHPEFANALYSPAIDQALYRLGPLRWRALYAMSVPSDIQGKVTGLRVAAVINGLLASTFVLSIFDLIFVAV